VATRPQAASRGVRIAALLAAVVLVTALAGCDTSAPSGSASVAPASSEDATTETAPPSAPTLDIGNSTYRPAPGRDGGHLTIGAVDAANIFQPYFVADASDRAVAAAAWTGLVTLGPDGRYLPALAAAVPSTADGSLAIPGVGGDAMTVRWRLRDGLAWSDGEPLTCDDVRWTWQWAKDPDNIGIDATGLEDLKDVECRSATDMVWHFGKVYGPYLDLLPTPLPRHALEAIPMADLASGKGFTSGEVAKLPVNGPFRFVSAVPGANLEMARNDKYAGPISGKRAHLEKLTWRWYPSADALVNAVKARQVDVAIGLSGTDIDPAPFGERALSADSLSAETLILNWAGGTPAGGAQAAPERGCSRSVLVGGRGSGCPVADRAIRAAIAAAIDRDALVRGPLAGRATPITSDVPSPLWFASSAGVPGADIPGAKRILDAAGWKPGPGGTRVKDGLTAHIEICTLDAPWRVALAGLVAQQLGAVGIAAEVSRVSSDDLAAETEGTPGPCSLPEANFDVALVPVVSSTEPLGSYFAWHSSQIPPNGTNVGAVADPDLDAALDAVRAAADPGVLATAMGAVERAASASVPDVPLLRPSSIVLVGANARNVVPSPVQSVATWNAGDWFLAK
jgi:peptide/nickel transport system substrate-binding protein